MSKKLLLLIIITIPVLNSVFAASPSKGEQLAWTCFSCHGVDGVSQGPATPVIAGISENYIIGAMLSYKYADDLDKASDILDKHEELEDVRVQQRFSAMMNRIAKAYSLEEIRELAYFFSQKEFIMPDQAYDKDAAKQGKKLHKKYCEKCHEDWGTTTDDDVGLLAGQWKQYLTFTLNDFAKGDREMIKKMKKKMKKMLKKHGDESLENLAHFYASKSE